MAEYDGFIKLYRKLQESPVWANSTAKQQCILINLLFMATWKEKKWDVLGKEIILEPGQFYTSLSKIKERLPKDISIKEIRTALERFEKLSFVANEATKHGRLITIINWDKYQGGNSQLGKGEGKGRAKEGQTNKRRKIRR